jgi:hypothetical protein
MACTVPAAALAAHLAAAEASTPPEPPRAPALIAPEEPTRPDDHPLHDVPANFAASSGSTAAHSVLYNRTADGEFVMPRLGSQTTVEYWVQRLTAAGGFLPAHTEPWRTPTVVGKSLRYFD